MYNARLPVVAAGKLKFELVFRYFNGCNKIMYVAVVSGCCYEIKS
jgi:hypothetical protein